MPAAATYQIQYTDPSGTLFGPFTLAAPTVTTEINCNGVSDGRSMDIQLRVTTTTPETSPWSIAVTLICADYPQAPATPIKILGTLDILEV